MIKLIAILGITVGCHALCVSSHVTASTSPNGGGASIGVVPITSLSMDNPNHKQFIQWFDNYKQRTGSQTDGKYQTRDQNDPQDLLGTGRTPIDEIFKLAFNQPIIGSVQTSGASGNPNHLTNINQHNYVNQAQPNTAVQFVPYTYNPSSPDMTDNLSDKSSNIDIMMGAPDGQIPGAVSGQLVEHEPFLQTYLNSMQDQNKDRRVMVEVNGDGQTILDQIRPLLRDKSIIERLRGSHLDTDVTIIRNVDENGVPVPVSRPDQQMDYQLRHELPQQQTRQPVLDYRQPHPSSPPPQQNPIGISQYINNQHDQQLVAPKAATNPPRAVLGSNAVLLVEQRGAGSIGEHNQQLMLNKLQDLAMRPLIEQEKHALISQTKPYPIQAIDATPPTAPPTYANGVSHSTPTYQDRPVADQNSAQQSYMNRNYGYKQVRQSAAPVAGGQVGSGGPTLSQQHLSIGNNVAGVQYVSARPNKQESNRQIGKEADAYRKQRLREELLKGLEDQERRRQELMDLDTKQRLMIAEARRRQEVLDKLEAKRLANEHKSITSAPQPTPPTDTIVPVADSTGSSDGKRYTAQQWPQSILIRNQLVNTNRESSGKGEPVDVLHSIRTIPVSNPTQPAPAYQTATYRNSANDYNMQYYPESQPTTRSPQPVPQKSSSGRIVISADALAQAEKVDAEYIKRLMEILNHTQPTGAVSTSRAAPVASVTQPQAVDHSSDNWWLRSPGTK